MRKIVTLLSVLFIFTSCNSQNKELQQKKDDPVLAKNEPKESWKVNKEYDEQGNLIRLDSTYIWSFSSEENEISSETLDSLMNNFRLKYDPDFPSMFDDNLFGFFTHDSIGAQSFFQDDFFMNNWNNRIKEMEEMMRKSDSVHKLFLDEHRKKRI
ncbi:hypothetical protein [Abyssalbus ytuae]|uniref:Lipoprotein n=1 Tax=Abyssalbus ytuae TaxID=2926907 RepID=A0A9E6ZVI4_9FLAO|nr:hypothetical protein [Abyssalbus ytuae]UOB18553.1 hypothetical protein MQE35_04510 [Abyssalbus ytuae]